MQKIFALFLFLCFSVVLQPLEAQPYLGPKVGVSYATMGYKQKDYLSSNGYKIRPIYGFQMGAIMHYAVNRRWSVHMEFNYSRKGREIIREGSDYIHDRLQYNYIELPLLFRISFGGSKFRWYLNVGPHLSYYLNGEGNFSSSFLRRGIDPETGELTGGGPDILNYTFGAGSSSTSESPQKVGVESFNYIQMGIDLGAGITIPVIDQGKLFFLDFRYGFTQSHLGKNEENSIQQSRYVLLGYNPNFEGANRTISVSMGFVFSLGYIYTAN